MTALPQRMVLWDTEYTTWEGAQERDWSGPNEYRELVQIGASRFNTEAKTEEDSFQILIKPVRNPQLSQYFIDLTHIPQASVDTEGVSFLEAAHAFRTWIGDNPCYAFGRDKARLDENCMLHGVPNAFDPAQFFDVREVFKGAGIDTTNYMSSTISEAFGVVSPHKGHDALGDARTIALALSFLLEGRPIVEASRAEKLERSKKGV